MSSQLKVIFHPQAEQEFLDTLTWYADNQSVKRASAFRQAITEALQKIVEMPEAWTKVPGTSCRRYLIRKFPYLIVFRIVNEGKLHVIAIAHNRRRPGYWESRTN